MHFVNTDLWDTAKLHIIMSIAMYDYSSWWRSMTTNKNKSEPSMSLCQDLVDFIPFVSFLEVVDHIMAVVRVFGHYLHSLMLKTQWLTSLEARFLTGWWGAIYWQMKIVAAKMIGMPLTVDCWRPGIWWWDYWCSSRSHCCGWVCRYWCQCREWAWQY